MFDHICNSCHRHQLIFPGQVTSLENTERGIEVEFVCWCGASQTWLTGTAAAQPREVVTAA